MKNGPNSPSLNDLMYASYNQDSYVNVSTVVFTPYITVQDNSATYDPVTAVEDFLVISTSDATVTSEFVVA